MRGHQVKTLRKPGGNVYRILLVNVIIPQNFCPVNMQGDIKWLEFGKEIHDYRKVIWAQTAMNRFVKKLRGRFAMGKNSRASSRDVELRRSSPRLPQSVVHVLLRLAQTQGLPR